MGHHTAGWPWPGDSREDKAKRVAASYRQLVLDIAQGRSIDPAGDMHRLDMTWIDRGVYWHTPHRAPIDLDEWVTAADAAHLADVEPGTIRKWAERGHITANTAPDGSPRYNVGELIAHQARQRRRRQRVERE